MVVLFLVLGRHRKERKKTFWLVLFVWSTHRKQKTKENSKGFCFCFVLSFRGQKKRSRFEIFVLVVKTKNKTPYELFRARPPFLDFMKPFGCHVTILNTIDHLGKFEEKSDEGFYNDLKIQFNFYE